jgi:hypothetical protein
VIALCLAVLIGWFGYRLASTAAPSVWSDEIVSVEAVRAGLMRHPANLLHRSFRVRGIAIPCPDTSSGPHCLYEQPQLLGIPGDGASSALPLDWDPFSSPLLRSVRRLPLLEYLAPSPQVVRWGVLTLYRVRLRRIPCIVPGTPRCFEAVVLDGAPPGWP